MAILTNLTREELELASTAFAIDLVRATGVPAGSVNTSFTLEARDGSRWFLRLYEEQDLGGARVEAALLGFLAGRGVPTPEPRRAMDGTSVIELRGKPCAVFPYVEGRHRCQASVTNDDARRVGEALARVHLAGRELPAELVRPNRFSLAAIAGRLDSLETLAAPLSRPVLDARSRLRAALDELESWAPTGDRLPLVHGDLFRDNVLFAEDGASTLLDFESSSDGLASYDLSVTMLAWCFGDRFEHDLARSMALGYKSVRSLTIAEVEDLYTTARVACVRFATTRITDFELRPRGVGTFKDYRRWLARLDAVEALGPRGWTAIVLA
ncbi:MAG: homoserine kinase [Polyangiaceae bacterium]